MKVGTDAVLLGAWANIEHANRIADAGCGSGIIALMAAQRNSRAFVTGIEIDADAANQASENCANSPFNKRIRILNADALGYEQDVFDHVLCNPPFHSGHVKPVNEQRMYARHAVDGLESWFRMAFNLTTLLGKASFVLPFDTFNSIESNVQRSGWFISRYYRVIPREGKVPVRILIELSKIECTCTTSEIQIETNARGQYHKTYRELVKDFYLFID